MVHYVLKNGIHVDRNTIPNSELIQDFKYLEKLEAQYFKLCKKYCPTTTFQPDDSFRIIVQELGYRQIEGVNVKTINVSSNDLIQKENEKWGNTMCPCCAVLLKTHNQRGLMHCLWYVVQRGVNLKGKTSLHSCNIQPSLLDEDKRLIRGLTTITKQIQNTKNKLNKLHNSFI